jgi:hypothetical protein
MSDVYGLAYQMEEAYKNTKSRGAAIVFVKDRNEDADLNILNAMWLAIDAYIDKNPSASGGE